jgi:hypothetical protein
VISPSQRPLPDNTQHLQQTDIHAPGGIRNFNPSRRSAASSRLRPLDHWDWPPKSYHLKTKNKKHGCLPKSIEIGCNFVQRVIRLTLIIPNYILVQSLLCPSQFDRNGHRSSAPVLRSHELINSARQRGACLSAQPNFPTLVSRNFLIYNLNKFNLIRCECCTTTLITRLVHITRLMCEISD